MVTPQERSYNDCSVTFGFVSSHRLNFAAHSMGTHAACGSTESFHCVAQECVGRTLRAFLSCKSRAAKTPAAGHRVAIGIGVATTRTSACATAGKSAAAPAVAQQLCSAAANKLLQSSRGLRRLGNLVVIALGFGMSVRARHLKAFDRPGNLVAFALGLGVCVFLSRFQGHLL